MANRLTETLRGRITRHMDDIWVAVAALATYLATLAPSVTTGDSGELITAAAALELAHPTGYPLYILLGKVFTTVFFFLPPDLALNGFSAFTTVVAVLVVRRLVQVLTGERLVAVGTALLFAWSASVWSQATSARVYALNTVLVALVLLDLARLHAGREGNLSRAWALWGLSMANHTVAVVMAPVLLAATWRYGPSWFRRIRAMAWAVPGLSLYLYIPLAASLDPFQNWGNPSTLDNLFHYLARTEYWDRRFVEDGGDGLMVVWHYLTLLPDEFTWPGAVLLLAGLGIGLVRAPVATLVGVYLFGANMALMIGHGSRSDIFHWPRYMLTGWLGLTLVLGLGLSFLVKWARNRPASILFALGLPALALVLHYRDADRSGIGLAREFNETILRHVEEGATVFAEGDNVLFPLIYLHHVEGVRPDVTLVLQGINELSNMVIDPDNRPIYFTHHHNLGARELTLVPEGLLYRLVRKDSAFMGRSWDQWAIPSYEETKGPGRLRYLDRNLVGDYLFMKAINHESDRQRATRILEQAMAVDFDNTKTFLNAGLIFERNLQFEEALAAYRRALHIDEKDELAARKTAFWEGVLDHVRDAGSPEDRVSRLGAALYENGRRHQAVRVLHEAVQAFRQSFKLRYNLAVLLIAAGDLPSARAELEAALAIRPDDRIALRDLDQVRRILASKGVRHSEERALYNGIPTRIEFVLPGGEGPDVAEVAAGVWREFDRIGDLFDAFDPDSEVGRLNTGHGKGEVAVSSDMAFLVEESRVIWEGTTKAFDPTVWTLKTLWRDAERLGMLPDPDRLSKTRAAMGLEGVRVTQDRRGLVFDHLETGLDFGGIVKGYAVDRAARLLAGAGATSTLVQCGGEIRVFGQPEDSRSWSIGIRHPVEKGKTWGVLSSPTPLAVSTSGHYEQPHRVKGREYYHIFDPRQAEPIPNRMLGVTVLIAGDDPSAARADGLATAMAVLGPEEGLKALARFPGAEALFIVRDEGSAVPREVRSPGMDRFYGPRRR